MSDLASDVREWHERLSGWAVVLRRVAAGLRAAGGEYEYGQADVLEDVAAKLEREAAG